MNKMKIKPYQSEQKIITQERLENGIKNHSDRYIIHRYKNGELFEVHDKNTGFLWKKIKHEGKEGWIWVT